MGLSEMATATSEAEIIETLLRRGWVPPRDAGERNDVVDSIKNYLFNPEFCGVRQNMELGQIGQRFCRWPENRIAWHVIEPLPSLGLEATKSACQAALADIEQYFELEFPYAERPGDAQVVIEMSPLGGPAGVLAQCSLVPCGVQQNSQFRARMEVDTSENWVVASTPTGLAIDWQRVFAHEFMHALGLGHVNGANLIAPMYSTTIRTLQPGDVAALEQLGYRRRVKPLPAPAPQPVPTGEALGPIGSRILRPGTAYTPKKRAWVLEEL